MELARIERTYGCVAEYQRSMYEEECLKAERQERANNYYAKNKELMQTGHPLYFADDCKQCEHYQDVGMTNAYDDMDHGVCRNQKRKTCSCFLALAKRDTEVTPFTETQMKLFGLPQQTLITVKTAQDLDTTIQMLELEGYMWTNKLSPRDLSIPLPFTYVLFPETKTIGWSNAA